MIGILLTLFRPLLFSSFDPEVAQARGVPVRLLGIVFLILVAFTVSMSVQVVGVLLIFTLLVGPAATANRIVSSPLWAILIPIVLGLCYTWLSIFLASAGTLPVSFYIAALSFGVYFPVRLLSPLWRKQRGFAQVRDASKKDPALSMGMTLAGEQERGAEAEVLG